MTDDTNPHFGSALEDFLREEGIADEVNAAAIKHVLAWQIEQEMKAQGISKAEMVRRMGTSRAHLNRLLDPRNDKVQLDTIQRAASALGRKMRLELERDEIRQDHEARHCEERSDEAIQPSARLDCFASLAMTTAPRCHFPMPLKASRSSVTIMGTREPGTAAQIQLRDHHPALVRSLRKRRPTRGGQRTRWRGRETGGAAGKVAGVVPGETLR